MTSRLEAMLELHEGYRTFPYYDSVGKLTIGIGFNIEDVGLLPDEITFILRNRINLVRTRLADEFPFFGNLDEVRQSVLIDMAYNLGISKLRKFRQTLKSIEQGDYASASVQMLDSLWARQVGVRAKRLSKMMETGEWPAELQSY